MKSLAGPVFALVILSFATACSRAQAPPPPQAPPQEPAVIFPDGFAVQVDLATTPEQQAKGLMYVNYLPPDRGMLFLFQDDERRPFWMKNCLIALDLVWLDEQFRVVDISANVQPCKADPCPNIFPSRAIRNVLEVQAGLCAAHHLVPGDRLVVVGLPALPAAPPGGPG